MASAVAVLDWSVASNLPGASASGHATREDLIWMKRIRGSKQDAADIKKLEADE
jgi:hypothetical protein